MKWKSKLKQSVITALITCLLCFASYQYALSTVPLAGPYYLDIPFADASYYVGLFDSGDAYMIDCDTWRNTWSSSNHSAIINACYGNLTSGRKFMETILIASGDYELDVPIRPVNNSAIKSVSPLGARLIADASMTAVFCIDDNGVYQNVSISGFYVDGNNNAGGIYIDARDTGDQSTYWYLEDMVIDKSIYANGAVFLDHLSILFMENIAIRRSVNAEGFYFVSVHDSLFRDLNAAGCGDTNMYLENCASNIFDSMYLGGSTGFDPQFHCSGALLSHFSNVIVDHTDKTGVYFENCEKITGTNFRVTNPQSPGLIAFAVGGDSSNCSFVNIITPQYDSSAIVWGSGIEELGTADYNTYVSCNTNATVGITLLGANSHVACSWNGTSWIDNYP